MNRPIKFRAWDKNRKTIFNLFAVSSRGEILAAKKVNFGKAQDINNENCVLMQFTGLHDKNGKEIYEGDIIKTKKEFNPYTGLKSDIYGGMTYEVKNNGWKFYLEPTSIYDPCLKSCEIIGNIYENPELLTPQE